MTIPIFKQHTVALVVIFAALLGSVWAASAKAEGDDFVGSDVQAVCDKAVNVQVPVNDIPTDADQAALKNWLFADSYYGNGVKTDYTVARKCAFNERASGDESLFGGSRILMMIYANGYGVTKNLDLAIKFACESGGSAAEVERRVHHLNELKTKPADQPLRACIERRGLPADYCNGRVDVCDDVTDGEREEDCAQRASDIVEAENKASMHNFISSWPAEHQKSFEKLYNVADLYFGVHATNEVDLWGCRAAFGVKEQDSMRWQFRASIKNFENGKTPSYTTEDFAKADRRLNAVYAAALKTVADRVPEGITTDGIRRTQKGWLIYRNAWVRFAALRYPAVSSRSIKTWLTLERIGTINAIPLDLKHDEWGPPTQSCDQ
jgi:uncharacterized protein YecT (DUF1311 family)